MVEANYIHDLNNTVEGHPDGISVQGAQNGTIIRDNHIEACGTSAIFLKCDFGPIVNTTVQHNRLKNMPTAKYAFPLYSVIGPKGTGGTSPGAPTGTVFKDNVIQKGQYGGYWAIDGSVAISGNVDYDTGVAI